MNVLFHQSFRDCDHGLFFVILVISQDNLIDIPQNHDNLDLEENDTTSEGKTRRYRPSVKENIP
jgi:hypothetical protein